ncbi:aldehyde dehydrogenase family protein [Rhodococcus sp. IEGM 1366]|uniref:aldehyde dehydrogenase family protein n=1 Tax=Rhodococcus sp. IEGM 1366 TaxID=3082223 RepID=UPI0029551B86|nr:aldehyde dehydrogenase family protein [Rhodococcus sp. IEGM 1366]MDV8070575.1 aldehyde dehydrogenase family protein [Rhodococcus sp. IEGM 1366]
MTGVQQLRAVQGAAWINGQAMDGDDAPIDQIDPSTGAHLYTLAGCSAALVDQAVEAANTAVDTWGSITDFERARKLLTLAELLRTNQGRLAHLESLDTGKPLRQAKADVDTAARYFEFYGALCDKTGGEVFPTEDDVFSFSRYEPYGVVGQVVPWNAPLSQLARGVAPALAAKNTVVVKPSELTPSTALEFGRLADEAGIPSGVVSIVVGLGKSTGAALVGHPLVRHVSFTGSVNTGTHVMASAARRAVPVHLELGGKSPLIVMADADLDAAVDAGANAIIRNSGQSCFACTRVLVHESVHDEYVQRLVNKVSPLRPGRGLDDPDLGPLSSAAQVEQVLSKIRGAVSDGARIVAGGDIAHVPDFPGGFYVQPTVLTDVDNNMAIAQEEVFGPVQSVLRFSNFEQAIQIANDSEYGLSAGIFTRDFATAHRAATRLSAGQVFINRYGGAGVESPFGGYRKSGIGREKGVQALRAYSQLKTIIGYYG